VSASVGALARDDDRPVGELGREVRGEGDGATDAHVDGIDAPGVRK